MYRLPPVPPGLICWYPLPPNPEKIKEMAEREANSMIQQVLAVHYQQWNMQCLKYTEEAYKLKINVDALLEQIKAKDELLKGMEDEKEKVEKMCKEAEFQLNLANTAARLIVETAKEEAEEILKKAREQAMMIEGQNQIIEIVTAKIKEEVMEQEETRC